MWVDTLIWDLRWRATDTTDSISTEAPAMYTYLDCILKIVLPNQKQEEKKKEDNFNMIFAKYGRLSKFYRYLSFKKIRANVWPFGFVCDLDAAIGMHHRVAVVFQNPNTRHNTFRRSFERAYSSGRCPPVRMHFMFPSLTLLSCLRHAFKPLQTANFAFKTPSIKLFESVKWLFKTHGAWCHLISCQWVFSALIYR